MPESTAAAYQEILERLGRIEASNHEKKPPEIPLIDPTANVLKLVEKAVERMDDLRAADDKWSERIRHTEERWASEVGQLREKLAIAESTRIDAVNMAESRRIDALFAEMKAAVALASEKAAAGAAQLATAVAAAAQTTATALEIIRSNFDTRVTRIEQQQYQTGGRDIQRGEGRLQSNWLVGILVVVSLAALQIVLRLIGK
jgi:hypothetical protein